MTRIVELFRKLSLQTKLVLIGLVPTMFFLYVSLQYFHAEKQKLSLLHNNIRLINRADAVNKLIEQLGVERRFGYEFALKKDELSDFKEQFKNTDSAIENLEKTDPELKDLRTYTMLDGLERTRQAVQKKAMPPDGVMGYYTTTMFRISYLDATPELLLDNSGEVNQQINGLKTLSEMNIYLGIINANIYNVLYANRKYAVGTLYGLVGLYQVYNTFEREFMLKASPGAKRSLKYINEKTALKPVITYLDTAFKRMNIDSTYNDVQWWKLSGSANDQLKSLQARLSARVSNTLISLEASENNKVQILLILLVVSLFLIAVVLSLTIRDIRIKLTGLRIAAEKIAVGETGLKLGDYTDDVIGKLAASVAKIDENNKTLAVAATAIGGGNFDIRIKPRGNTDLLGNALLQMKDELQHFTTQKLEYAAELERLLTVIRESETHFRKIADKIPLMIWQTDDQANAIYVNRKWLDYTGFSFEQSMGLKWLDAMHPDDRGSRAFPEAFAQRVSYRSRARFRNTEGEYRWMDIQGNPIFGNQVFEGFIGSLTDITHQMEAEQAMMDLMYKKDEFLSIASHELRTPLTSIKAYTQLLEKTANREDKSYQFVGKMLNHVSRLERLINDLLDVSRINSGRIDYNPESFQFAELLKNSVEAFSDITGSHEVVVENVADVTLKADRSRIEQVFNNLLSNAAKYSPDADKIWVDSRIEADFLVVSVKDVGVGIPKKDQRQLFERFYRSEKTSHRFQGLGLGLFISAEIIRRHGGDIWVQSNPDGGSVFYFKLPLTSNLITP
ncbi:MAG TPA: ATP-binding protein [Mucilaginibacter sp.]|nr:ATP-binding protein [Mucilaginibacter sp.]